MEKYGFMCCICNSDIIENNIDPIDINIIFNEDMQNKTGRFQNFYAHFHCFKEILHENIKGYFVSDND